MPAVRQAKIYATKRTALEDVIPLKVPFSVQIDVCSACNIACAFCVHSDADAVKRAGIKWGFMSLQLFRKIIDDMKNSWAGEKVKKLRLFQMGEPLLNPAIVDMVKYAKDAQVADYIEITTNATLLTPKLSMELITAGLDFLIVSVNGITEKQYRTVCNYQMDFVTFRDNLRYFYDNKKQCQVWLKYGDIGYSKEQKDQFYELFEDCCDQIFVETISATLWQDTNVADKIVDAHKGTYGQKLEKKRVCPFIFTTLIINDQGIAHLCCADWKCKHILGDLKKASIADIWGGEKLREYQIKHLSMCKDDIDICVNCESLSANNTDNVDAYSEEILKRLSSC